VELNDHERALVLAGLFELRITHLEDTVRCGAIDALAEKLGGDPSAMFFGAPPLRDLGVRCPKHGPQVREDNDKTAFVP
jgi:hypothetical protein